MLKTENINNYEWIKSIADVFCDNTFPKEYNFTVFFEHGQFYMIATTEEMEYSYSIIDTECSYCLGDTDYCPNCNAYNGVGFELLDTQEI